MHCVLLRRNGLDVQGVSTIQLGRVLDESMYIMLREVASWCVLQETENSDHVLSNELLSEF